MSGSDRWWFPNTPPAENKDGLRQSIAAQVERFLERGGKIEVLPTALRGDELYEPADKRTQTDRLKARDFARRKSSERD